MTCEVNAYKHYMIQGDTGPSLRRRILNCSDNTPVSLAGATVDFLMVDADFTIIVNASAVIESPASDGSMRYDWAPGDTDTIGTFRGRFKVTFAGGMLVSFPGDGWIEIEIKKEFGS